MKYEEFLQASERIDSNANDRAHFFSSLISKHFAYFLAKIGFSPNSTTFLFLIVGISSGLALISGYYFVSYILWRLHIVLDMADGIIARAQKRFSKSARGFDRSNHIIINLLFIIGAASESGSLVIYITICTFLLNYMFARNYYDTQQMTQELTSSHILLKNCIGIEGFVFVFTIGQIFYDFKNTYYFFILYSLFFLIVYFYKLIRFTRVSK